MDLRFLRRCDHSISFRMTSVGEFGVGFIGTKWRFRKRKKQLSSICVFHTLRTQISRRGRRVTTMKCAKKCDEHAELAVAVAVVKSPHISCQYDSNNKVIATCAVNQRSFKLHCDSSNFLKFSLTQVNSPDVEFFRTRKTSSRVISSSIKRRINIFHVFVAQCT